MTQTTTASQWASFWIGSYTVLDTSSNSYNPGIARAKLNLITGELAFIEGDIDASTVRCEQPSYLYHMNDQMLAVSEHCAPQQPQLLFIDKSKGVQQQIEIKGDAPCHVQFSEKHGLIVTAQYMGGTLNVFSRNGSGAWGLAQKIQRTGTGPLSHRQESAHIHQVQFLQHSDTLVATDLGCDQVLFFAIQEEGQLKLEQALQLPAGRGPRHLTFSHDEQQLYVLCELSESLCHFQKTEDNRWQLVSEHTLLSDEPSQEAAAAIKLSKDGQYLYASARGQNKIVSFSVAIDGQLTPLQSITCGGEFPRDFTLSPCGQWIVVANQHSHSLSVLKRDVTTGLLEACEHTLKLGSPVCILFD